MKLLYGLLLSSIFALVGCGSPGGLNISGKIDNAANLTAFFDKKGLDKSINSMAKSETDGSGNFKINVPDELEAGLYRVRIGAKSIDLILDGSETNIKVAGDLNNLQTMNYTVEGSALSEQHRSIISDFTTRKMAQNDLQKALIETSDPLVGMSVANVLFANNPSAAAIHKAIHNKLAVARPDISVTQQYGEMIKGMESALAAQKQQSSGSRYKVNIGDKAPDISMPDVSGRTRSLSDLEGSIVLIDFWASWCGPCRRANPGVVETYHKYKDKGFTVFSVSLDGLDSRTKARFQGNQEVIDKQMESSKKRWTDAIAKDKLAWDTHVSDLKKWDSAAAGTYGVRSIPTTFLLDREGKIAALNPRHTAIEAELLKLL